MPTADADRQFTLEELPLAFHFGLEDYMMLSQSRRVDHDTGEVIEEVLPGWGPHLKALRIETQEKAKRQGYVLVWLETPVEAEVNAAWEGSPSRAFVLNTLAQSLLMAALREAVPDISESACAPVPVPTKPLRAALAEAGVPWQEGAMLGRQYAMLTYAPYQGSCDICHVKADCPKLSQMRNG
ncbi:hypothetical protein [Megalodesulfovibrio gigas]|uniref:Uncharacterized protein n=1 Tax=Megalodesulfovibrio gigas (strain ATCC 19364 / DSM 1382 / NCIMB 9332 / VKM B-1759) TaxID=1121448 RepID=T2GE54_MEGG1|nr:hypothetical protein [Megalodesulfovibrio gigas]AGW14464.1 hypothetical protein DGI_2733 [Megalodesulfovibrio gigas DSM 1382 = ATCC 19364]